MNLSAIRDSASRFIGSAGTEFDLACLSAMNSVVSDLRTQCFLDLPEVDAFDVAYDLDEQKYSRAMRDGVLYYIQLSGEWSKESDIPKAYGRYQRSLALAQYHAITDLNPEVGTEAGNWSGADSENV